MNLSGNQRCDEIDGWDVVGSEFSGRESNKIYKGEIRKTCKCDKYLN
jgi:hypothetical protein